MTERDPSQEELDQREPADLQAVPVVVEGPVRNQALPSQSWSIWSDNALGTEPQKIAKHDPRRRAVTVVTSGSVKLGPSSEECRTQAAPWPADAIPFVLETIGEVWAAADSSTIAIVVTQEYWSE